MNEIQNSLFEAMKAFTNAAAANSDATITIQGSISSIVDSGLGEYSIDYLGNTFSAYANSNVSYSVGDIVYIIVPDGDFSKNKIILGLVNPSVKTFVNEVDNDVIYYEISDNLIDNDLGIIKMSSYETTNVSGKNITNLPSNNFNKVVKEYLTKYRTFSLSFLARTFMTVEQQNSGNYGVSINIPLIEHAVGGGGGSTQTWKTITLDVGNLLGNPYRLEEWSPQAIYFTIDEQYDYDTSRLPNISYFCYGFNQNPAKTDIKDIWIKDISFNIVDELVDEDTSGYRLTLKASQGIYFSTHYDPKKTLTPTLRINGKTTSIKNAEVYWFVEDVDIKPDSKYYSPYGGYGWHCLNKRTNVAMNADGTETYDYVTNAGTLDIEQREVGTSARYKCVVVHNKTQSSATIVLKNLDSIKTLELKSTNGSNVFIKDTGYVNLTTITYIKGVTEQEANKVKIIYSWMRYDKNGLVILDEDSFFNTVYYNKMVKKEINGSLVDCYETQIKFPVNKLEETNNVFCTARYINIDNGQIVEELIGTDSILISTSIDFDYTVTINNANQLYKYDSDGDSPAGSAYDGPSMSKVTSIPALTYTIKKANGEELSKEEYCYVKYTWTVPKNSMFTVTNPPKQDENNYYFEGYDTYNHTANLTYGIASRFNITKANKKITLKIEFQGKVFEREVPITFTKEGMNGTNGTSYAAELVAGGLSANTSDPYGTLKSNGVAKKLKFVYNISNRTLYRHDYDTNTLKNWSSEKRRIYPRVYYNGSSFANFNVEFSMFDDKITNPCFRIAEVDSSKGALLELSKTPDITSSYCNIVQAKITPNSQGSISNANQTIYCYYPIELTVTNFNTEIIPSVDGGFAEVMYASDGTNPSWDETSAFICNDDLLIDSNLTDFFDITWNAQHHLTPKTGSGKTFSPKPDNKYDDGNSLNLVKATLNFREDKYSWLNNEINRLNSEINNYRNEITKYNSNKASLENFARMYKGEQWNNKLNEIKDLLDRQTTAAYRLNTLLETSLVAIDNYINTQYQYNKSNIKDVCRDLINDVAEVKTQAQKALVQIQKLNGEPGYGFSDLVSLENKMIILSESTKEQYKRLLGLDSTITIQLMVDDINRQISEYQADFNKLKTLSPKRYEEIYRSIQTDIRNMCNQIPNNAMPMYRQVKENCLAYLSNFDRLTSIKDIKKCIDDMYNYVLRSLFVLRGGTLELNAAAAQDLSDRVQRSQDRISADQKKISDYQHILNTRNKTIVHHRPIVLYFNRYEMSNINAWDGNKIETGDGSYLLAPQVGAGVKEADNSFTGIVMGLKNVVGSVTGDNAKKGLFGYYKGNQTICLDASNGSAIFGKSGSGGQIIIDPATTDAMLYSSNFFKNYNSYSGLPTTYGTSNYKKEGMMINLSKPEIRFGNGNFVVDKDGNTTIAGTDNKIGGWRVTDTQIHSDRKNTDGRITLDSGSIVERVDDEGNRIYKSVGTGKIYSHNHDSLTNTGNGFYLSADGLSLGSKIKITNDGIIRAGNGAVAGTGKHWTIDGGTESHIAYNTSAFDSTNLGDVNSYSVGGGSNQVYLGTDGIRLGNKFAVDSQGNAVVKNLIAENGGSIGGWSISSTGISSGNIRLNKNGSIASSGDSGSWSINQNGSASFSNVSITGGSLNISGNASIDSSGNGVFNNITCNNIWSFGNGNNTWTNSGFTFGNGSLGGNAVSANAFGFIAGTIGLGTAEKGKNGISYSDGKCEIAGDIYANNGYFEGEIVSSSGSIGGWKIDGNRLKNDDGSVYLGIGGISVKQILCPGNQIICHSSGSSEYTVEGIRLNAASAQTTASEAKKTAASAASTANSALKKAEEALKKAEEALQKVNGPSFPSIGQ